MFFQRKKPIKEALIPYLFYFLDPIDEIEKLGYGE